MHKVQENEKSHNLIRPGEQEAEAGDHSSGKLLSGPDHPDSVPDLSVDSEAEGAASTTTFTETQTGVTKHSTEPVG